MELSTTLNFTQKIGTWSLENGLDSPWNHLPRPWVFTNGCFDLIHRGHVSYLAEAKSLGQTLIVALNTDDSVRRLNKGIDANDQRPINTLEDRSYVIAALASVDMVLSFNDATPLALIQTLHPDILVKGGDWPVETIVGSAEILARGGQVHSIPFRVNRSTTALVRKLRSI